MGVLILLLLFLFVFFTLSSNRRNKRTGWCPECWKHWTLYGEDYRGFCSKRCLVKWERSWAETMDFYDVDDPNNPAYSNPAHANPAHANPIYSDSSPSSPIEDENSEKPSLKSILRYIFFFMVIIYAFLSILAIFDII